MTQKKTSHMYLTAAGIDVEYRLDLDVTFLVLLLVRVI